jgi:hypothetical protein
MRAKRAKFFGQGSNHRQAEQITPISAFNKTQVLARIEILKFPMEPGGED